MACNPCPCGDYHPTDRDNRCTCAEPRRRHYRRRVTGPMHDRIDIVRHVAAADAGPTTLPGERQETAEVRGRVAGRGARQAERYSGARAGGSTPRSRVPPCVHEWPLPRGRASPRGARALLRSVEPPGAVACTGWPGRSPTSGLRARRVGRRHGAATAAGGAAAGLRGSEACLVTDDDRLARVALGRLTEPGDPRVARLVAEMGGVAAACGLRDERDSTGLLTEVATRLRGLDPVTDLAAPPARASATSCPVTTSGRPSSTT